MANNTKYFWADDKHLFGKRWPICQCLTCASDYEDKLTEEKMSLSQRQMEVEENNFEEYLERRNITHDKLGWASAQQGFLDSNY